MSELRIVVLVVVLVAAMWVTGVLGARYRLGAVGLALVSVTWLLVNSPFEGVVLFPVLPGNGVTSSDLVGLAGLAVAAVQLWQLRPARRPTNESRQRNRSPDSRGSREVEATVSRPDEPA